MKHDPGYKLLFSQAQRVEDLLRGFVHEEWVRQLDFSTLEKVSGSYVSDDLRDREDDILWRVRWGEEWLYVYLLLEFQSTGDAFMAVRIMTYLGLLYQDLIHTKQLTAAGKLPPVLPLVLYNGRPRWNAATEFAELIENEDCYSENELAGLRNVAAAFFRLEKSRAPEDVQRVSDALVEWLQASAQLDLRRDFTLWLKQVFLPGRMPGVDLPEIHDLQEIKAMLEDHVVEWTEHRRSPK